MGGCEDSKGRESKMLTLCGGKVEKCANCRFDKKQMRNARMQCRNVPHFELIH